MALREICYTQILKPNILKNVNDGKAKKNVKLC